MHTNRELGLMLRGLKPLAEFADCYGCFPAVVERYLRLFDRQVLKGTLVSREYVQLEPPGRGDGIRGVHVYLFALPGEDWRIDAMINLRTRLAAWTEAEEREEGHLLGYEDWQNDHWIANAFHGSPGQAGR